MISVTTVVIAYTHVKEGQTYQNTAIVCHTVDLIKKPTASVQEQIKDAIDKAYDLMPESYRLLSISHTYQIIHN